MECRSLTKALWCLFFLGSYFTLAAGDCKKPSNLKAEPVSPTEVRLSWTAGSDASAFFIRVEEGDDNPYDLKLEKTVHDPFLLVKDLKAGEKYDVRLRAICGDDHSNWTEDFVFTAGDGSTGNPPSGGGGSGSCEIPTGVTVSEVTDTSVVVSWNSVAGAQNYELEVEDDENTPAFNFNVITGDTSFLVTGLVAGGQYQVKVKSRCSGGNNSEYTDWLFFQVVAGAAGNPPAGGGSGCEIPAGLKVSSITDTSVMVTWNSAGGAGNYELEVEDGENTPAFTFNVITDDTSSLITGLAPGGQYKVKVKSKCSGEDSAYNSWVFFQTRKGPGLIAPVPVGSATVNMEIFPNPARDEIRIRFRQRLGIPETIHQLEVRDMTGRVQKVVGIPAIENDQISIPVNDLKPGIYVVIKRSSVGVAGSRVMVQ